jgi:N-methylhydantoinase A
MARFRVSADIGGTFTDFVVMDGATGAVFTGKVLSTPANPALAVLEGIKQLIPAPEEVEFMVHGTTVGLNAFLERKGARVLLIATAGVGDYYTIARGDRTELYKLKYHKPDRLVPRRDVHEIRERVKWDGAVVEPLHVEDFEPIIAKARAEGVPAIAVCLIHSYAYPQHELEARDILTKALPGVSVTLSHEVSKEWREYERASTAIMNAYIAPRVEHYLSTLIEQVRGIGMTCSLHVMQSSGGVMTADTARKQPVRTLLSGPVGGAIGATALSERTNRPNLICVDMGGTSFDMSLIVNGKPPVSSTAQLQGLPVLTPIVDIHTIGAGGGSLAWLEAGGLRVGPQSAGADPGPACYGRGGTRPTVTDAHLFLKRLGPASLLEGKMTLDEGAAAEAIHTVAAEIGLEDVALAEGMLAIVNAKMADAIRTITVAHGIDPRDYALLAFGGAGPMHAAWLAKELNIREVVVPFSPGTYAASGMLQTDVRHDLSRNFYRLLSGLQPEAITQVLEDLTEEGRVALREQDVSPEEMYFQYSADMRYVGQEYAVNVPLDERIDLAEVARIFHAAYQVRYGHSTPAAPVEFVVLRTAAQGRLKKKLTVVPARHDGHDPVMGTRSVVFDGRPHSTPVVKREWMPVGVPYVGPLVIEEQSATTVVPPGYKCQVDDLMNIVMVAE